MHPTLGRALQGTLDGSAAAEGRAVPLPPLSQTAASPRQGAFRKRRSRARRVVKPQKACPAVPRRHLLLLRLLKRMLGELNTRLSLQLAHPNICCFVLKHLRKHISPISQPSVSILAHQWPCSIVRVDQNHIYIYIYTVHIRLFWQGHHQTYGHIRCICTVLANPKHNAKRSRLCAGA
jgi:hypothetical protein